MELHCSTHNQQRRNGAATTPVRICRCLQSGSNHAKSPNTAAARDQEGIAWSIGRNFLGVNSMM